MNANEFIKKEFITKYDIDLGDYTQYRESYEFSADNEGYKSDLGLFLGIHMGDLSASLSSGHRIVVEPVSTKIEGLSEEELSLACERAYNAFKELQRRAKALSAPFNL